MMKIVCISASQVPSSTANSIQVMKVCQALAQLGHEVHLFVPGRQSTPWENLAGFYGLQTAFHIEWLPARRALRRYDFSLAAILQAKALRADAVYAWPPQAAIAALLWRMPVLLELHAPPEGKLAPLLFRLLLRLPGEKRLLPITRALVNMLEQKYKELDSEEIVISPNGVDLERFQDLPAPADARQAVGLPENLTIACTGHLYAGRGMDLVVELARRFPQAQFLWVGGRTQDVDYWREKLAVEQIRNFLLPGFITNDRLPLFQAAADILLMPYERSIAGSSGGNSADYCSPMKMFEYIACGRAILSSDLPVLHEVLNEKNAIFCQPEDVESWARALQLLLDDPGLRERLGQQAAQDVISYSWKARAEKALRSLVETRFG